MPGTVDVIDVRIAREWLSEPSLKDGSREPWVELVVRVRNTTPEAQYVVNEMRGLVYDDATRTLTLRLCDRPPATGPSAPLMRLTVPKTTLVPPGLEAELRIETPAIQKRIVSGVGLGMKISPFDLRDVAALDIEVAHAREAPDVRAWRHETLWGEIASSRRSMMGLPRKEPPAQPESPLESPPDPPRSSRRGSRSPSRKR